MDDLQKLKAESPVVKTFAAMDQGDAKLYVHPMPNTNMVHPDSGQVFSFDGNFLAAVEASAKKWLDEEVLSPATLVRDATVEEFEAYKEKLKGIIAYSWPSLFTSDDPTSVEVPPAPPAPVEETPPPAPVVTTAENPAPDPFTTSNPTPSD